MLCYRKPKPYDMVFIDSSAIDEIRSNHRLNTFFETYQVMVWRSPSLEEEMRHKNTPDITREPFNKGFKWIIYDAHIDLEGEKTRDGICEIMKGDASDDRHQNDALHIFSAADNEGYLIAIDKRIIKKRDKYQNICMKINSRIFGILTIGLFSPRKSFMRYASNQKLNPHVVM